MKKPVEILQTWYHINFVEGKPYYPQHIASQAMEQYAEQEAQDFAEWTQDEGWSLTNSTKHLWEKTLRVNEIPKTTQELYKQYLNSKT